MASARNLWWLCLAGAAVGASGSVVHLIIPFAAHLAPPKERGRVVGQVDRRRFLDRHPARADRERLGRRPLGLADHVLAGSRLDADPFGGRSDLPCPAACPNSPCPIRSSSGRFVRLAVEQPALREASLYGGRFFFCVFSAFWTTLVFFRLEAPPYHHGAAAAGMFGLVGAVGAAFAPLIGRIADRHGTRMTIGIALSLGLISFLVLGFAGDHLAGLIAGVILLDLGVQAGHVANQNPHLQFDSQRPQPAEHGLHDLLFCRRLALGSILGAWGWHLGQWWGRPRSAGCWR